MGITATPVSPDTRTPGRITGWLRARLVPLAIANLCANILLVVTGGVVRLTSSGLGCPTWPKCTEGSYVRHGATGIHGVIEFSNRMLTYVLTAIAIAVVVAAWKHVGRVRRLAIGIALGIPLQAVIGGISVLTDLNPWVVSFHLLASMAMICLCVWMLDILWSPARGGSPGGVRGLAWATFAAGWVVLWLGTVVTGSGPHSGDLESKRTGLDPATMSHIHAFAVYVLVALTVWLLVVVRRQPYQRLVVAVLLGVQLAQGVVGWIQYETGLPAWVVGLHMLGAALTAAGLARVVLSTHPHADSALPHR